MKKVLNIVLLFILGLGLISCDRMLKDPLVAGSGFGDVILNEANVTFADSITSSALNFTKAEVKIDGKTGTTGVSIKNIKSGNQTITIPVPSADGKKIYSGSGIVVVKANEQADGKATLNIEESTLQPNAYKVTFDPSVLEITGETDVFLVGTVTGWQFDKTIAPLTKNGDKWEAVFTNFDAATEFKISYGSTDWGHSQHLGTNGKPDGANFKAEEYNSTTNGVKIEPLIWWKVIFDPSVLEITGETDVFLVGTVTGWQFDKTIAPLTKNGDKWEAVFTNFDAATEFKISYGSTDWGHSQHLGTNGKPDGANFKAEEYDSTTNGVKITTTLN